jgi:uncharacterized protein YnzC (UPF0291/DUF896 family)
LNYSQVEAWDKLEKINELDKKAKPNETPKEKIDRENNIHFLKRQCRSNLNHSVSNIKLLAVFSGVIPETLVSDRIQFLFIFISLPRLTGIDVQLLFGLILQQEIPSPDAGAQPNLEIRLPLRPLLALVGHSL